MEQFGIGEAARRIRISPTRLRQLEQIGAIPAPRRAAGRRIYSDEEIERLVAWYTRHRKERRERETSREVPR